MNSMRQEPAVGSVFIRLVWYSGNSDVILLLVLQHSHLRDTAAHNTTS